jgi:hypothetical protein
VFARNFLPLLFFPVIAGAGTLKVGPAEAFVTIQAAIDAANPGDVIEVAPGLYAENLTVGKSPLTLSGARAGDAARGRVPGVPDPLTESVVAPVAGSALVLSSAAGTITVDGFSFEAPATAPGGVVMVDAADAPGLALANNHVRVTGAAAGAALWLNRSAVDATLSGNVFLASAASVQAIFLDGADSFDGLHFTDNDVLRTGGPAGTGFFVDGVANLGPSPARPPRISGNRFAGHALGFNGGSRSLKDAEISFNLFENNSGGMAAGPADCLLKNNRWAGNTSYGLRLTGFGNTVDPARGARGNRIEDNEFENNGTVPAPAGSGDLRYDDQADGNIAGNLARRNRFGSLVGVFNNEVAGSFDAASNHWGAADGPGGNGPGSGAGIAGAGSVTFEPWYADSGLTVLNFGDAPIEGEVILTDGQSVEGDPVELAPAAVLTVGRGARLTAGAFTLQAGSRLEIHGGSAELGKLTVLPGAEIDVVDGDLSLDPLGIGQYHTLSGSFTFFNCLGSLEIHANTTFSGSTLGIASDIHVDPGVTLIVLGSLVLDGCQLDSSGTFNIQVNAGATFKMTRCEVTGAVMSLVGSDLLLRDNFFRSSALTVFSTVNGAGIYHNVFEDGPAVLNLLPGAVVTTTAEGWGNVTDPEDVRNRLSLDFRAPADPTRTLDAAGNLFVQPGDMVDAGIDIGELFDKAQAVEALLGYSTDYLEIDSLVPSSIWNNGLYAAGDGSAVIGRFNTAVGLGFSHPDPDGTLLDGEVADVRFTAKSLEGWTRFFFREKGQGDEVLIDTRITSSTAGLPYFREMPFTRNSAVLTVDGTIPEFAAGATAVQVRDALPVDILQSGAITRQGVVTVTFDSRDLLAGIDDVDAGVEFVGTSATLTGVLVSASPVVVLGDDYTRYVFEVTVGATAPNGIYDVNGLAMDRSGNQAVLPIGAIEISKNRIQVTVAPQGLVATPITRNVAFVATDAGGAVLASWTVAVNFSGGLGSTLLEEVPDGTVNLSAKMAWNLRRRLAAGLDLNGQGTVSFTGVSNLRGGDLNGNNLINSADYNILSVAFPGINPVADITGNGVVNSGDYNILAVNWLTAGDPP